MAFARAQSVTTTVNLPFVNLSGTWVPDRAERDASWEMMIELSTRVAAADLGDDEGSIREGLASLYALFAITRGILREHGPEVARSSKDGNLSFAVIALRVLNDVLRPVLSRWHPDLEAWEQRRPDTIGQASWERQWDRCHEARADLAAIRPTIRQYVLVLAEAAQVPEMADAVLVRNGGANLAASGPPPFAALRRGWRDLDFRPRVSMVRWFDPLTLVISGARLARFRLRWGRAGHTDAREHFGRPAIPTVDHGPVREPYEDDDGAYWFDYVADLGDAFEPTMAVAWWAGRNRVERRDVAAGDANALAALPADGLARGSLLVLGGDEVYPYPSARRYRNQVTGPYSLAHEGGESTLLALPGNHDWDDNLAAFRDVFCEGQRHGGWQTVQDASFFSVRLPGRWWLWGIDTGLDHAVGPAQTEYFQRAAEQLADGDRLIVCSPVPLWRIVEKRVTESADDEKGRIEDLLATALSGRDVEVPLFIAPDFHVYAHYVQRIDGRTVHQVTSAGGGAFLHPTHNLTPHVPQGYDVPDPFILEEHWPPRSVSRWQLGRGVGGALFDRQSLGLGTVFALVNLAILLGARRGIVGGLVEAGERAGTVDALRDAADALLVNVWFPAVALAVVALFTFVVPRPSVGDPAVHRAARRAGFVHGLAQVVGLVAAATIGAAAGWLIVDPDDTASASAALLAVGSVAGGFLGVAVFATYVQMVNRRWRIHDNIAFAGRHIQGFKHFLRCRIDRATGDLRLYVLGLPTIHTGWAAALARGTTPPKGMLTLVDVIDIPAQSARPGPVVRDEGAAPVGDDDTDRVGADREQEVAS